MAEPAALWESCHFSRLQLTRLHFPCPLQGSFTLTWTMSNDLPVLTSLTENSTVSTAASAPPSVCPHHQHVLSTPSNKTLSGAERFNNTSRIKLDFNQSGKHRVGRKKKRKTMLS